MKICRHGLSAVVLCYILTQSAYGDVSFMGLEELVAVSDVIAVIEVTQSEKMGEFFGKNLPKKGFWSYAQRNNFKFIEFIKAQEGAVPDIKSLQVLWAQESFICANVSYTKGRYLVFLENVGKNEWVTLNFQFGGLPIDEDGNVARFGVYKVDKENRLIDFDFSKAKEAINVKEAREMILKSKLNKKQISFYARVDPAFLNIYNIWRDSSPFQKLYFHIEEYTWINEEYTKTKVIGKWPKGLILSVRGYINTSKIDRGAFLKMTKEGGAFKIRGVWKQGYLYLESIQSEQTKEYVLKRRQIKP